jgi:hypothetical protein
VAALKYIGSVLEQQQQQQQQQDRVAVAVKLANFGENALCMVQFAISELLPRSEETLAPLTLAVTITAVVAVHTGDLQALTNATSTTTTSTSRSSGSAGGGGSSWDRGQGRQSNPMSPATGSSSSSSSSKLSHGEAWDLVLQNEQQLPTFHPLLFDVLGLSQRLLAWLASLGEVHCSPLRLCWIFPTLNRFQDAVATHNVMGVVLVPVRGCNKGLQVVHFVVVVYVACTL